MSAPIRVAIRADAGRTLGTGHYSRASAVADALSAAGGTEIILVTGREGASLVPNYFPSGIDVVALDDASPTAAMEALRAKGWAPDVIYLDHYGEVAEWEAQAAEAGAGLLALDDLDAARRADIIVRPHGGEVEAEGILLKGPVYLPLSNHVTAARRTLARERHGRLRLNVCFGGTDPTGETRKALQALASLELLDADVVIGPGATVDEALIRSVEQSPNVTLHRAPSQEQLATLLARADLALGAGGVMLWERLCIGVPSLVILVAENQRPQIDAMSEAGAIRFVGDAADVTVESIADAIKALAADKAERESIAATGQKLVDGRGAVRLAAWLRALAIEARDVTMDDARALLEWRTDERNWQHNWEAAEKPDLAAHAEWLQAKLASPDCVFRILTLRDEPVGVVRFDLSDEGRSAYLSIYLVPAWHGRKIGLPVLFAAERALRGSHPDVSEIVSRIHRDNAASERLHRDAGFDIVASQEKPDWLAARKAID